MQKTLMSSIQKEIWWTIKLASGEADAAFNRTVSLRCDNDLNIDFLQKSIVALAKTNGLFKLRFMEDGEHTQWVEDSDVSLISHDFSNQKNADQALKSIIQDNAKKIFDLVHDSLARFIVCKLPRGKFEIILTYHEAILDESSLYVLLNHLSEYYTLAANGHSLAELSLDTKKYDRTNEKIKQEDLSYWQSIHTPAAEDIDLPVDGNRPAKRTFAADSINTKFDVKLTNALRELARDNHISLEIFLYLAFCMYLSRLLQRDDLVVGVSNFSEINKDKQQFIGNATNLLPFRVNSKNEQTFQEFIATNKIQLMEAYRHNNMTISALLSQIDLPRDASRIPLVPVMFGFNSLPKQVSLGQCKLDVVRHNRTASIFELSLDIQDNGEKLSSSWVFNSQLCSAEMMQYRVDGFTELLQQLVNDPNKTINAYEILSAQENKILSDWNQTWTGTKHLKSIPAQFIESAEKRSQNPAIYFNNQSFNYDETLRRSYNIVAAIQKLNIPLGESVAVHINRSEDLPLAMIAVMMSGCAYIPLDPNQPISRLAGILEDARPTCIISDQSIPEEFSEYVEHTIDTRSLVDQDLLNPLPEISLESIAYIIYTSGSTGKPKGVAVKHKGLSNIINSFQERPGFDKTDRLLAVTTAAFDIAGLEFFLPLSIGAQLFVAPDGAARDPKMVNSLLHEHRITVLQCVPTAWQLLLSFGGGLPDSLRGWCGGEALPADLIKHLPKGMSFWNVYGPTETTIWSTIYPVDIADAGNGMPVSIGKPIDNTSLYVLDESGRAVPIGVTGTLWIGGAGVASHYHKRSELTKERFRDNHLSTSTEEPVLYDTGDLVRFSVNGELEYVGRKDFQVKIRGFRIELGEIESVIVSFSAIDSAVVVACETQVESEKKLLAFYTANKTIDNEKLNCFVKEKLPQYFLPAQFIQLDEMPLNTNGKVDRKALINDYRKTVLDEGNVDEPYAEIERVDAKSSPSIERWLEKNISQIVGVSSVSVIDNFFDIGVTSLGFMRLLTKIHENISDKIAVTDLFTHNNIVELAAFILSGANEHASDTEAYEQHQSARQEDDIAIIGMAGRFPGAKSVSEFWQALLDGEELISHFSDEELEMKIDKDNTYVKSRGVVENADYFDAQHFGIPPKDAEKMDPQHRILLEVAQEALEDAGYDPKRYSGKIGVFAGSSHSSYLLNNVVSAPGAARALAASYPIKDFAAIYGNEKDYNISRIAYKLNLTGPAINVQTSCSTSLVAVAQACDSLQAGTSDVVLAGGISITFPQKRAYLYTPGGMASLDGHCRTFDVGATGTVFGDGAGLVVLKRLKDAQRDGDDIISIIRGYSVNNDGADKAGYAAPSIKAQADVIESAHRASGFDPSTIGYVEAHGTGTPLGDPIEFAALTRAFSRSTDKKGFCALGTAKTNVGHLDIAAGITGLIKTAMTLKTGKIPALLHYTSPNPNINFEQSAFYPVTELTDWKETSTPRRAGVSSFGVGGTNVHVVLEQAPKNETPPIATLTGAQIFPVSASNEMGLQQRLNEFSDWWQAQKGVSTTSLVDTLRYRREHYAYRQVIVAESAAQFHEKIKELKKPFHSPSERHRLVMLLPGQGSQHVDMAASLYEKASVFREQLQRCASLLEKYIGSNILDIIYAADASHDEMAEKLKDTSIAQPAIFVIEYALIKQWKHWGIVPDLLMGHSVGELAAACVADVISLDDALRMIALRGQLMTGLSGGAMLSVRASEQELNVWLENTDLDLAAVNGAKACVVAGSYESIDTLEKKLQQAEIAASRLHTSHAFHSRMMDEVVEPFYDEFCKVQLAPPKIPIFSTVNGEFLSEKDAVDPRYWAKHLRHPVRFYDGLKYFWENEKRCVFLEVGPGKTLSTLASQNPVRKQAQPALATLPHVQDTSDDYTFMTQTFGALWACGYQVSWDLAPGSDREKTNLAPNVKIPSYPFQRKRYWIEPHTSASVSVVLDEATQKIIEAPADEAIQSSVMDQLKILMSDLSGFDVESMDADQSFLEMGFDSLLLTQAIKVLYDSFSVKVSLRQLIDSFDTLQELVDYIEKHGQFEKSKAATNTTVHKTTSPDVQNVKTTDSTKPLTRIEQSDASQDISDSQQRHIDTVVKRFNEKTAKSKALTQEYRQWYADPRTAAGFNRLWKEAVYQIVSVKSKGSRFIDIDGNEYIDILNGFGPGFLGHSPDHIVEKLHQQVDAGFEVGPQSLIAMEASKLFCEVTGNQRTSFVTTGSEAVYAAMRLARTCTSRDKIVIFARDYHGNFDEVLVRGVQSSSEPRSMPLAPGIPVDAVKNIIVLPYGTPQSLDYIRQNAHQLAAVMVEPVQSRRPEFQPVELPVPL